MVELISASLLSAGATNHFQPFTIRYSAFRKSFNESILQSSNPSIGQSVNPSPRGDHRRRLWWPLGSPRSEAGAGGGHLGRPLQLPSFSAFALSGGAGALSPANIAAPLRRVLRHQKNTRVLLAEAVDIDVANRRVVLSDGEVAYDTLIVASGARHAYFGKDQWEVFAPGLKTIEDAIHIRRRILLAFEAAERESDPEKIRAWLTFVIVGAGPTGVELAGALGEISNDTLMHDFRNINPSEARILLVEGADRVLPPFPPPLSRVPRKCWSGWA